MSKKLAIIGLGVAARTIHLPAYKKLSQIEVVGGFDPNVGGEEFPFPVYKSVSELLEKSQPDIVSIATPTQFHFDHTKSALDFGCHVFCEKPFMSSLNEADEIIRLANQKGKWVVVNNEFRCMEIHSAAKAMIGKPSFGALQFVSMTQTFQRTDQSEAGWRGGDPQRTAKEFGIHALDLCRFYFNEDPHTISARMPKGDTPTSPDYLNLINLEFSGDRVAHILLDRISRGPHRYLDTRLDGTEGCIEMGIGGKVEARLGIKGGSRRPYAGLDISLGGQARLYGGEKSRKLATDPFDLFPNATANLMRHFLNALEKGSTPMCHAEDNRKTLALMLAAYESSARGAPVSMRY